jgi:hypothetical protein
MTDKAEQLAVFVAEVRYQASHRGVHYPEPDPQAMGWDSQRPYKYTRCRICGFKATADIDDPDPDEVHYQYCVLTSTPEVVDKSWVARAEAKVLSLEGPSKDCTSQALDVVRMFDIFDIKPDRIFTTAENEIVLYARKVRIEVDEDGGSFVWLQSAR